MIYKLYEFHLKMKIMKAKHISNLLLCNYLKTLWLETIIYYFTSVKSGGAVQGWGSADLSWVCMQLLSCLNRLVGRPDAKKGVQNSLE